MTAITDALRIARSVRLADIDPHSTPGFDGDKQAGERVLAAGAKPLADLQERLFAASRAGDERAVLLMVQGMDTAGKGGIMRHVVGQVDPQGVAIKAFKAPTAAEKRHDFLWRIEKALPTPGMIGVFDRSHYEDVLIHRVRALTPADEIQERYGRIVEFEQQIADRGIHLIKVMLHISRAEQGARLLERLDRADKHWKYNPGDVDERDHWDDYMEAYQVAINRTARASAPWYVVPADRKWFARLAVHELLVEALQGIDPQWPAADFDVAAERERLLATGDVPEPEPEVDEADEQQPESKQDKQSKKAKKGKKGKKRKKAKKGKKSTSM
ncbi:polyphosphate:nucleotide phosphotransferase, PPK2 family [Agrococcus baldri]|uniref:Polyphosphate:nucleotide phosphotransferase, PPK2 family n=1 Tax=Agrococcus baldri TaxID=153730 RepID=A0AA94KZ40_9MICO|nr:PPK2 family polyphosphate kinase [Agrococcus baldri]SFS07416.1 polyphosphate:nucleotide phosphotransferase, PPK2 family [Agrococcus baldri]